MLKVAADRCDECLFSPNRIVSAARKAQILAQCARNDSHFVCHKPEVRRMEGEAVTDTDVVCRGFYDRDPEATNLMRIMGRVGGVVFVDEQGEVVS